MACATLLARTGVYLSWPLVFGLKSNPFLQHVWLTQLLKNNTITRTGSPTPRARCRA
jgi:hypothetical protein